MTALVLYGLAYAQSLSPDDALQARVREAVESLSDGDTDYAKDFAMRFRSTPRALDVIAGWQRR